MLSLSESVRYFLYREGTDMRKSFNGLSGLVNQHFEQELLSGDVFIFINKRRDKLKLLQWERTGFAIYYKQLEAGTFELPMGSGSSMELDRTALMLLLAGIELQSVKQRKRYRKSA